MSSVIHPHEIHGGGEQLLSLDKWANIRALHGLGHSIRKIARDLDIDRNTVRKAIRASGPPQYVRISEKPTKISPYLDYIKNRAPLVGFNATRIFEEIRRMGYDGGYSSVRDTIRPLRDDHQAIIAATMRFETPPGKQAQVDWGSCLMDIEGKPKRVHIFVMVLGHSRAIYVEFTDGEKFETLISCHEKAFDWFGGLPEEILYDNPKTIVSSRDNGLPKLNPNFEDFASYHGFLPRLCQPRRPQTKGKVESGIKYVKRSFVLGSSFPSIDAANLGVKEWIRNVADCRIHGTTHQKPEELFREEKLNPVRRPSYILQTIALRKVPSDCLVSFNSNRYSVPWRYAGKTVDVQNGPESTVRIYHEGNLIAAHDRIEGKHQVSSDKEHYRNILTRKSHLPPMHEVQIRPLDVYELIACGGEV